MAGTIHLFDLTDLCNCPDPCTTCCGVATPCCVDAINRTLFATFTDDAGHICSGFAGLTVTLAYNSGTDKWSGSTSSCGTSYTVDVWCDHGTDAWLCNVNSQNGMADGCAIVENNVSLSGSCSPFSFATSSINVVYDGVCACCLGGMGGPGTVSVTMTVTF